MGTVGEGTVIGLLWYDVDKKRTREDKIAQAARRYKARLGRLPSACYINPTDGEPGTVALDGTTIRVLTSKSTLRHH